jgi:hypothetical protein
LTLYVCLLFLDCILALFLILRETHKMFQCCDVIYRFFPEVTFPKWKSMIILFFTYIICMGQVHCDLSMFAYSVPWLGLSLHFIPSTTPSQLKQLQQVSLFYFHISI